MLLDTSGLFCLLHELEAFHGEAVGFYRSASSFVTHNYILAELVVLAHRRRIPRQKVFNFYRTLVDNPDIQVIWPDIQVIWVDKHLHASAITLLEARLDKDYSVCDAVSFILMSQRSVNEALTTDRHFEQEGFVRLLKS